MIWWQLYLLAGVALSTAYVLFNAAQDVCLGPTWRDGYRFATKGTYLDALLLALPLVNLGVVGIWAVFKGGDRVVRINSRLRQMGLR